MPRAKSPGLPPPTNFSGKRIYPVGEPEPSRVIEVTTPVARVDAGYFPIISPISGTMRLRTIERPDVVPCRCLVRC